MRTVKCHRCGEGKMLMGRACHYDNRYFCSRDCERNYYTDTLADINRDTDPRFLAVCRAWHGENFAMPGYGSLAFVREELGMAEQAVLTLTHKDAVAPTYECKILRKMYRLAYRIADKNRGFAEDIRYNYVNRTALMLINDTASGEFWNAADGEG